MELGQSVRPPRTGERWLHKGTGISVTVLYGGTTVRWKNENGGVGKDSIESFLDRFEMPVDLMAALEESLKEECWENVP